MLKIDLEIHKCNSVLVEVVSQNHNLSTDLNVQKRTPWIMFQDTMRFIQGACFIQFNSRMTIESSQLVTCILMEIRKFICNINQMF